MTTEVPVAKPESAPHAKPRWRLPFRFWRNCFVGMLLISPLLSRAWFLSKVPDIDVPFDVDAFCRIEIPSGLNAFDHYREADRLLTKLQQDDNANKTTQANTDLEAVLAKGWSVATEPLKEYLRDRREALAIWKQGTDCPDALYHPPTEVHFNTLLPATQSLRSLCRLAQCEAAWLEAEGNLVEFKKCYTAILRSSRHSGNHGGIVERSVGCSLHETGSQGLIRWAEYPQVTADQLRSALLEVKAVDRLTEPVSSTLKNEFVMAMNTLNRVDWLQESELANGYAANEPVVSGLKAYYWIVGETLSTRRVLRHILANQLAEVDKPILEQQPVSEDKVILLFQRSLRTGQPKHQLAPADLVRASIRSPVTNRFLPNHTKSLSEKIKLERLRQLNLEVTLAAQAYRRDHVEFPEALQDLVPSYLDNVPVDPCDSRGQPIRYLREDSSLAVVWSVGPDGRDGEVAGSVAADLGFGVRLKIR